MRSPNSTTFRSSGIGSGSSDSVETRLYIWPIDSMRISRVDSARFRASQANGCISSLWTSSSR